MSLNDSPKQFWSSVKSRTGNSSAPSYIEHGTQRAYSTVGKADLLNVFFTSVFNDKHEELPCQDSNFSFTNCVIDDLVCTENDVLYVLSSIDVIKASGADNIHPTILKECTKELLPPPAQLFNYLLFVGKLPTDWKIANVVPIYKSGERSFADNYRLISLTSIVVKTMERIIHKHFMDFFEL